MIIIIFQHIQHLLPPELAHSSLLAVHVGEGGLRELPGIVHQGQPLNNLESGIYLLSEQVTVFLSGKKHVNQQIY